MQPDDAMEGTEEEAEEEARICAEVGKPRLARAGAITRAPPPPPIATAPPPRAAAIPSAATPRSGTAGGWGDGAAAGLSPLDSYKFDLQGFLLLEGALSPDEVAAACNHACNAMLPCVCLFCCTPS